MPVTNASFLDPLFRAGEMFTRSDNLARDFVDTTGEQRAYINTPQTAADMNSILDTIR